MVIALRTFVRARRPFTRGVHDYVRGTTPDGSEFGIWRGDYLLITASFKVSLNSPRVTGVWTSRGEREYVLCGDVADGEVSGGPDGCVRDPP